MYYWGMDLSMDQPGIAIFDSNYNPIHIDSYKTNKKYTHGKRLWEIGQWILELKKKYPPQIAIIERGFSRFNTSTQVIYRVHGLINYLLYDVEQIYYPPKKIKEAIIRGDATKKLLQKAINIKYKNVKFDNEDESDAFAIVLAYLILNKKIEWNKKWI